MKNKPDFALRKMLYNIIGDEGINDLIKFLKVFVSDFKKNRKKKIKIKIKRGKKEYIAKFNEKQLLFIEQNKDLFESIKKRRKYEKLNLEQKILIIKTRNIKIKYKDIVYMWGLSRIVIVKIINDFKKGKI